MLLCAKASWSSNMPALQHLAGYCCAQQTPPCMGMLGCFAPRSGSPGFTMALMACLPTPFQASFCFRSASCTISHAPSDRASFLHCQSSAHQRHEGHEQVMAPLQVLSRRQQLDQGDTLFLTYKPTACLFCMCAKACRTRPDAVILHRSCLILILRIILGSLIQGGRDSAIQAAQHAPEHSQCHCTCSGV